MVFSIFELSAVLLTLSAILGWINHRYLPMPHTIGLLVMSVAVSLILVAIDAAVPERHLFDPLTSGLLQINFNAVVMQGMLAFLLFAGSLHVDLGKLRDRAVPVAILATFGTVMSTVIVGVSMWGIAKLFDQPLSLAWAMVFGALISPTDPVAVLSTLKNVKVPPNLEVEMQGESLFNDGIGIVLFTITLLFATVGTGKQTTASAVIELLAVEAGGGLLLGVATGFIAYWAMRLIDDYAVEVLISLALVTATYAIAHRLHVSGPLAVVAAGLLIGYHGPRDAMSDKTQTYVFSLWTLIDEILNSVLFLLIGLEVLVLQFDTKALTIAMATIPAVLAARLIAVGAPAAFSWSHELMSLRNVPFLTWAHAGEDQEAEGKLIERHASAFDNPVRGCRKCPKHQAEMFDFLAGCLLIPDAISAEADLGESRRFEADEICHLHRKPRGCANDTGEQVWILECLGQTPFFVLISQPARSR